MKKFQYGMENLLQIKKKLEDQAKIAYGVARLRLTKEEQKLELLKQNKINYEDELRESMTAALDLVKIKHCKQAIDIMKTNIKQQTTIVRNAEQRLEVSRIRLSNAMVEKKTQERLKDKAFEKYMLEFDGEERKEIDELNSFKYSKPTLDEEDL